MVQRFVEQSTLDCCPVTLFFSHAGDISWGPRAIEALNGRQRGSVSILDKEDVAASSHRRSYTRQKQKVSNENANPPYFVKF